MRHMDGRDADEPSQNFIRVGAAGDLTVTVDLAAPPVERSALKISEAAILTRHMKVDGELPLGEPLPEEDEERVLVRDDANERRAWQQAHRSACVGFGRGQGSNPASHDALATIKCLAFACRRCGSITDYLAALKARKSAGGDEFLPGDGCSARQCNRRHRPGEFDMRQRRYRERVHAQMKVLIRPPARIAGGSVTIIGRAVAFALADAAVAALPSRAAVAAPPQHRRSRRTYTRQAPPLP